MTEVRRRRKRTAGPRDNWTYEQRSSNIQGHGYENLKAREELLRRTPSAKGKKHVKKNVRWDTTRRPGK